MSFIVGTLSSAIQLWMLFYVDCLSYLLNVHNHINWRVKFIIYSRSALVEKKQCVTVNMLLKFIIVTVINTAQNLR